MAKVAKRRGKYILDYYDQFGKRHWETTNLSKKEAKDLLNQRLNEVGKGGYRPLKERDITFAQLADQWLTSRHGKVRPITVEQYEDHVKLHLLPFFGPCKVRQIDVTLVEAYSEKKLQDAEELKRQAAELTSQAEAIAAQASGKGREITQDEDRQCRRLRGQSHALIRRATGVLTINKTITTLGSILKSAVKSKIIEGNPVRDADRAKVTALAQVEATTDEERDVRVIPKDQITAVWQGAKSGLYRTVILTALMTGMRSEELFALQWGDIDWQSNQMIVRRVLTRRKGVWEFYEPKSKSSRRRIDVAASFLLTLKKWKLQQVNSSDNDLVFTTRKGKPLYRNTVRKFGLVPALKNAGLSNICFSSLET